jgi:aminotransferase
LTPPQKPFSRVVEAIPPSGIRKFFDLAQTMKGVITLGVGEPDFPTPWGVAAGAA